MKTTGEWLADLRARGIRITARNDRLLIRAPKGTLSADLNKRLAERKPQILAFLHEAGRVGQERRQKIEPAPRDDRLPLSFAQRRMWFLNRLEGPSPAYNMAAAFLLNGPLDVRTLERSLAEICRRHEALRTSFPAEDGEPRQSIQPNFELGICLIDLSIFSSQRSGAHGEHLIERAGVLAFDLAHGPLVRVRLIRTGALIHFLVVTLHHIVADGWSLGVMVGELTRLYRLLSHGKKAALPPLPLQYADFAYWQTQQARQKAWARHLDYWRRQLAGRPVRHELPLDYARPALASYRGGTHSFEVGVALTLALKGLVRSSGATLAMVLQAAWAVLLSSYSRRHELVMGTAVANRNRFDLEPLIGFFVNSLVLRCDLSGDPSFETFLKRFKQTSLEAFEHQDLPFERLVEALHPERSAGLHPLFQLSFVFQNAPVESLLLPGIEVSALGGGTGTAKFDLHLAMRESETGLSGGLEYAGDLFKPATISGMVCRFQVLLQHLADHPNQTLSQLSWVEAGTRERLHQWWYGPATDYPRNRCVHELFERWATRVPDRVALCSLPANLETGAGRPSFWTYHQAERLADKLAGRLRFLGVVEESLVGVLAERSARAVIAMLATLKAGGAYLPLDPSYPRERLARMVAEAQPRVVLAGETALDMLADSDAEILALDPDTDAFALSAGTRKPLMETAERLAYVMYTSGSTGRPKGSAIQHRNIIRLLFGTDFADFNAPTLLHMASVSFDAATFELWGALLHGGTAVLPEERVPTVETIARAIRKGGVDTLWLTSSLFNLVIDEAPLSLRGVRRVLTGGEALSVAHVRRARELLPEITLVNGYGPTEGTTFTCCETIRGSLAPAPRSIPIGRPIANTQALILDGNLRPLPAGMPGMLWIGGDGLARGYFQQARQTSCGFIPQPYARRPGARLYHSGDLARYLADGRIEFLGRDDGQIKMRGFRVELGEVEAHLIRCPGVRKAVVLPSEDGPKGKRLVAFLTIDPAGLENVDPASDPDEDHVYQWGGLFDDTYQAAKPDRPELNFEGWNDSYTGEPIPEPAMREWLETTVALIQANNPSRVLEIGCGTGLLLLRIAPGCETYVGTDISREAVGYVEGHKRRLGCGHAELHVMAAHELDDLPAQGFDTVILNSVVQYFPSVDYLVMVLERAAHLVTPGGRIIVGDVRNLALLETFHTSVSLFQARDEDPLEWVRRRVFDNMRKETELVIDPAFFQALAAHVPLLTRARILFKHGRVHNELTRFRYDVVLELKAAEPESRTGAVVETWAATSLAELERRLRAAEPAAVRVDGISNARVSAELAQRDALAGASANQMLASWRRGMEHPRQGIDPAQLSALAGDTGYHLDLRWSGPGKDGFLDALFYRPGQGHPGEPERAFAGGEKPDWRLFANQPQHQEWARDLVPRLRQDLQVELPDYMLPADYVVLDRMPLTVNGKLDRAGLLRRVPPPATRTDDQEVFLPPRTDVEKELAAIWCRILGLTRVGIRANFFDLGGHSLLATRVISRAAEAFSTPLNVADLFEAPTIEELAQRVESAPNKDGAMEPPPIVAVPREGAAPLSFAQQRLWFMQRLAPRGTAYNMAFAMKLKGGLCTGTLAAAFNAIQERHEVLRTCFPVEDGVAVQAVSAAAPIDSVSVDLGGLEISLREAHTHRIAEVESNRLFDLERGPVWRYTLLRLELSEQVLLLTFHHIAADGWSLGVLVGELVTLYTDGLMGRPSRLEPLAIQYADFALWQHRHLGQAPPRAQLEYWKKALQGAPDCLNLPLDHPRPGLQGFQGAVRRFQLTPELTRRLIALAGESRASLFMCLLSGFAVLLSAWSGQQDIVVGAAIANRNRRELEPLIGFFVNTLALRCDLTGQPGFRNLLVRIRRITMGAYAHQDVPFERVIETLGLKRDSSRIPLTQVGIALQNLPPAGVALPGLEMSPLQTERAPAPADLTLFLFEGEDRLVGNLTYNTALFEKHTIARLARDYERLLEAAAEDPERDVDQLKALCEPAAEEEMDAGLAASNLTENQWLVWLGQRLHPNSPVYNNAYRFDFDHALDGGRFENALRAQIAASDALRIQIDERDGIPFQRVAQRLDFELVQIDFSATPDPEAHFRKWAQHRCRERFDLSRRLFDSALAILSQRRTVWYFCIHHLISDGQTLSLILENQLRFYESADNGRVLPPSPLPSFLEAGAEQRSQRGTPAWRESRRYWSRALEQPAEKLDWYGNSPVERGGRVTRFSLPLAGSKYGLLQQLARSESFAQKSTDVALFNILAAALLAWTFRITGVGNLSLGVPFHNRRAGHNNKTLGLFMIVLPLRVHLSERETLISLAAKVAVEARRAFQHRRAPVANPRHHRAWDLLLNYHSRSFLNFHGMPVHARWIPTGFGDESLSLQVREWRAELLLEFDFQRDFFPEPQRSLAANHFLNLLEDLVRHPGKPIEEGRPLDARERRRLVVDLNRTGSPLPPAATVLTPFLERAMAAPDRTALAHALEDGRARSMSYGMLAREAERLGRELCDRGVGPEALVAIYAERSIELFAGILGILRAGGAYLPLDTNQPPSRTAAILEDARPALLLSQTRLAPAQLGFEGQVLNLDEPASSANRSRYPRMPDPAWPAYVIYTSGSSGLPKGVLIEHRALFNFARAALDGYRLVGHDRVLQFAAMSFDTAAEEVYPCLLAGATLVARTEAMPASSRGFLARCRAWHTTVIDLPTAFWHHLTADLARDGLDLPPCLRLVIIGGEAALAARVEQWRELAPRRPRLENTYGPTEATVVATRCSLSTDQSAPLPAEVVPIGLPIANGLALVLDSRLQPVAAGVAGELCLGGLGLARGYLNRPGLTAQRFVPDPFVEEGGNMGATAGRLYKSGDVVRRLPDGALLFLGRLDTQVKLRGFRIEAGEIESVLVQYARVREAAVILHEPEAAEKSLVAFVVADSHIKERARDADLAAFLRERLPDYMIPRAFVVLDALPVNHHGKLDRSALRRRAAEHHIHPLPQSRPAITPPSNDLERRIAAIWCELLRLDAVGVHDNFFDLGGHSLLIARLQSRLHALAGQELSLVDMFQLPTIASQAAFLRGAEQPRAVPRPALGEDRKKHASSRPGDIAVIGMAGRFPGAGDVDSFWDNLRNGVESVTFFSEEELIEAGIDRGTVKHPRYVRANPVLEGIELFDAAFFGITPREAESMDPQQRLFLECAWHALEHAGYDPAGHPSVGVFAGLKVSGYLLMNLFANPDVMNALGGFQLALGNDKDYIATRVSYKLNLRGPSVDVQSACSTSLVAIHMACRSLRSRECEMALAGGVSFNPHQRAGYFYKEGLIVSPDGHCRPFDAKAAGTIAGNGLGIVVLKPLERAIADGDSIHAIIKGSAMNNDGSAKVGFTAPGVDGQAEVIAMALDEAGVSAETIGYVEAHGTATALGDPIEVAALTRAYAGHTDKRGYCGLGSVKSNIGHLDSAAGVTGLIKAVLALEHGVIPPSLHFESPNPKIDFERGPFYVNTRARTWPELGGPRRAGVNSFGIGGTNCHLVLEAAPRTASPSEARPWQLLMLSAKSETALAAAATNLAAFLERHPEANLADLAYTLAAGRHAFWLRRFHVCRDSADARDRLRQAAWHRSPSPNLGGSGPPVIFMFSGQGAQHPGMGTGLYRDFPLFRKEVDLCAEILEPQLGGDPRELLFGEEDDPSLAERLQNTRWAQPALFVIEYALARLWMEQGIQPRAMIGHSVGEYVAACLAGVLRLEDALALVAARGRLMASLPGGAMLSLALSESELAPILPENVEIAAYNRADHLVVSGPGPAIAALAETLKARGVEHRPLRVSHAFHSSMMEPILKPFLERARAISFQPPGIPYISNVSGDWIRAEEATSPAYWADHLRRGVRFVQGLERLLAESPALLLEIGPGQGLCGFARAHRARTSSQEAVASMPRSGRGDPERAAFLTALGELWSAGVQFKAKSLFGDQPRRRIPLPGYAFDRERYWIDPPNPSRAWSGDPAMAVAAGLPPRTADLADWFYAPSWKRLPEPPPHPVEEKEAILIFDGQAGWGAYQRAWLERQGYAVTIVEAGASFEHPTEGLYRIQPETPAHYSRLLEAFVAGPQTCHILHLWNLDPREEGKREEYHAEKVRSRGFYGLVHLAAAIGGRGSKKTWRISVFSDGMHEVTGHERLRPEMALLVGPIRCIPLELPNIYCRCIDVSIGELEGRAMREEAAARWCRLALQGPFAAFSALRGGHCWVLGYEPLPIGEAPQPTPRLRRRGVYLITGGLGGIGLALAEFLARTVKARLVLTGRSAFPPPRQWNAWLAEHEEEEDATSGKIRLLRELESHGGAVRVLQADVTDRTRMRAVIRETIREFGPIHGVIHSAGLAGGGVIQLKTRAVADAVLDPKVNGTLILDDLLRNQPLDFFVLCSSLTSVLGDFGQVDYCSANAFMDAFAQQQTLREGRFTLSINWDAWREVGMAVDALHQRTQKVKARSSPGSPDPETRQADLLEEVIAPEEGQQAFARALGAQHPQVLVSTHEFRGLMALRKARRNRAHATERASGDGKETNHPRPQLAVAYAGPEGNTQEKLAGIWQHLLGFDKVGIHDNFFDLGGDSLSATRVLSQIRETLDRDIPLARLFDAPTVAGLAEYIDNRRWAEELPLTEEAAVAAGMEEGEL